MWNDGKVTKVAAIGDPAPGGGTFSVLGGEASIFFKAALIWDKRAAGARSSMKPLLVRPRTTVSSIRACPWAWEVNSNSYWSDQAGLKPRGQDRPGQLASKKQELFTT